MQNAKKKIQQKQTMKTPYISPVIEVIVANPEYNLLAGSGKQSGQTSEQDDNPAKGALGFADEDDNALWGKEKPFQY